MIIDLEQERKNGLDESQLARAVMLLMNPSEMCDGPVFPLTHPLNGYCDGCNARNVYGKHKRVPKGLREVRDDLIEWFTKHGIAWSVGSSDDTEYAVALLQPSIRPGLVVRFNAITDEPIALALGAVRLMEKQDANNG